jgi:hypothetical protein
LIITDGAYATSEMGQILKKEKIPVVNIIRTGTENSSGIADAMEEINSMKIFKKISGEPKMANIPRSHLGFMARVWEGTSGTRVYDTKTAGKKGIAFAVIVPSWAFSQKKVEQDKQERSGIEKMKNILEQNQIPLYNERSKRRQKDDDEDDDTGSDSSYFNYTIAVELAA